MRRSAPFLVVVPRLRQKHPPIQRARRGVASGVDRHPDLAVVHAPQRPRVLATDPHRKAALLRESRVVDDPRLRLKLGHHPPRQVPAHHPLIPRRLVDELLQALLIAIRQPGRHRLDRLALAIKHQSAQIDAAPLALLGAHQRTLEHLARERLQPPTYLRQALLRKPRHRRHTRLPSRRYVDHEFARQRQTPAPTNGAALADRPVDAPGPSSETRALAGARILLAELAQAGPAGPTRAAAARAAAVAAARP